MTETIRELTPHTDWTVLLPPGWATFPTDPEKARAAVRRTTDRMLRGRARDELVQARIDTERSLTELVEKARRTGAAAVHLLVEPVRGVPVSASLVVSELSVSTEDELARQVARVLGRGSGVVENDRIEVAGLPALRRRRRERMPADERFPDAEVWETSLDLVVETGDDELLVLTFATMTDEIADELVLLFDAIAESLHRR